MLLVHLLKQAAPIPLPTSAKAGALCVLALCFSFYFPLIAQSLQGADGGELVIGAVTWAQLHPPGYPLYMIFSRALLWLFPENPVYSLALFSAMSQALAAGLLVVLGRVWRVPLPLAMATALSWGLGSGAMRGAVDVEVFGLQSVLVVGVLLACSYLALAGRFSAGRLFLLGLVCGLAVSNHHMIVLWTPLIATLVVAHGIARGTSGIFMALLLVCSGIVSGMIPYLLLLHPSSNLSPLLFDSPRSAFELIYYLFLSGNDSFSPVMYSKFSTVPYFSNLVITLCKETPLLLFGVLCLIPLFLEKRSTIALSLFCCFLAHLWFIAQLHFTNDAGGSYQGARYLGSCSLALCVSALWGWRYIRLLRHRAVQYGLAALVVFPVFLLLPGTRATHDASQDSVVIAEAEVILESLPPRSVYIVAHEREGMSLSFLQRIRAQRPDIIFIMNSQMKKPGYWRVLQKSYPVLQDARDSGGNLAALVSYLRDKGYMIFASGAQKPVIGFQAARHGLVWEWLPKGCRIAPEEKFESALWYCSLLPDSIFSVSRLREHSLAHVEQVFLPPLQGAAEAFDGAQRLLFQRAAQLFVEFQGDVLRQLCRQELSTRGILERSELPRAYTCVEGESPDEAGLSFVVDGEGARS